MLSIGIPQGKEAHSRQQFNAILSIHQDRSAIQWNLNAHFRVSLACSEVGAGTAREAPQDRLSRAGTGVAPIPVISITARDMRHHRKVRGIVCYACMRQASMAQAQAQVMNLPIRGSDMECKWDLSPRSRLLWAQTCKEVLWVLHEREWHGIRQLIRTVDGVAIRKDCLDEPKKSVRIGRPEEDGCASCAGKANLRATVPHFISAKELGGTEQQHRGVRRKPSSVGERLSTEVCPQGLHVSSNDLRCWRRSLGHECGKVCIPNVTFYPNVGKELGKGRLDI